VKSALAKPASPLGVGDFVIHADKLRPKEKYANINHFTFSLLDGRVSTINIGYNGPAYATVDQFVSKFVEGTSLPPAEQWQAYVRMLEPAGGVQRGGRGGMVGRRVAERGDRDGVGRPPPLLADPWAGQRPSQAPDDCFIVNGKIPKQ